MATRPILLTILAMTLFGSPEARAGEDSPSDYQSAPGVCQGAFPASAGSTLRAKPLGIVNEGSAPAFVSCANQTRAGLTIEWYGIRVGSTNAAPMTISCTLVHGYGLGLPATYVTKSVTVTNGTAPGIIFYASELPDQVLAYPQVSCGLPAGGVVHYTVVVYSTAPPARQSD